MIPASGWLIVRSSEWLLRRFKPLGLDRAMYGIPTLANPCPRPSYRGIDRPGLGLDSAWIGVISEESEEEGPALDHVALLSRRGRIEENLISNRQDAIETLERLRDPRSWELIRVLRHDQTAPEPSDSLITLGFEPSYFGSDHFSPVSDALFFPRWHGSDPGGLAFADEFRSLNRNGLFQTSEEATAFLRVYLSQEWSEHDGDYSIVQVSATTG